jgi:hypothetical protein
MILSVQIQTSVRQRTNIRNQQHEALCSSATKRKLTSYCLQKI